MTAKANQKFLFRFAPRGKSLQIQPKTQKFKIGGKDGIRTRGAIADSHAFQACAFDHSATFPRIVL